MAPSSARCRRCSAPTGPATPTRWCTGSSATAPDGGSDTYELVIADGTCTLSPTPEHEPKVALSLGGVDFLKVVSGNANPMMLFMTGKLKAKGDLGLAAKIGDLFSIPKA